MQTEDRAEQALDQAAHLITGDRNQTYGDALHDFRRIGEVWAALLDLPYPIAPHTVAAMMTGLKLVRSQISPDHGDTWVDAAGYAALGYGITTGPTVTEQAP